MQSRLGSIYESVANVVVGVILAYIVQNTLLYAYEIRITPAESLGIIVAMTIVSFVRSYVIRRLFNRYWRNDLVFPSTTRRPIKEERIKEVLRYPKEERDDRL